MVCPPNSMNERKLAFFQTPKYLSCWLFGFFAYIWLLLPINAHTFTKEYVVQMNLQISPSKSPSPSSLASDSACIWTECWVVTHVFQLSYVPYTKKECNCFFSLPYMRMAVNSIHDVSLNLHHETKSVLQEDWIILQQITAAQPAIKVQHSLIYALIQFHPTGFLRAVLRKEILWHQVSRRDYL